MPAGLQPFKNFSGKTCAAVSFFHNKVAALMFSYEFFENI